MWAKTEPEHKDSRVCKTAGVTCDTVNTTHTDTHTQVIEMQDLVRLHSALVSRWKRDRVQVALNTQYIVSAARGPSI